VYDIIIKDGTIIDGTGAPRYNADVGIKDGKITAIGKLDGKESAKVIDAAGKCVTPGFIDYHSHSDLTVLMRWDASNVLEQGITTEIAGHCGLSVSPLMPSDFSAVPVTVAPDASERLKKTDGSTKAVMAEIESQPLPVNIAYYIGQGTIRGKVMGYQNRKATESELNEMKKMLRESMEAGALGMSTGLIYPPGSYTETKEIIELCKVVKEYGGHYTTHMRSEGNRVVEAVKEALRIGKESGVPVIISHHKIAGKHNEGKSKETLALANEARKNGQKVYFDQYPYDGGATSLLSAIPPKYATDGMDALIEKLKNPKIRKEIAEILKQNSDDFENLIYSSTPEGVILGEITSEPELNGLTLAEAAKRKNKDVYETMFDIICENRECGAIYRMICQWDLENIMKGPYTMGGTDSAQVSREEIVADSHPRGLATFPKIIGQYCRDKSFFTLEECIRKLCGLPAEVSRFTEKGKIAVGKDADIVVFDFNTIDGKSDYGKLVPNNGIDYVFVNGQIAVENGKRTSVCAGKLLRRTV